MRLLSLSEVSIQKRTSPGKLGIRDFEISFAFSLVLAFELTGQQTLQSRGHGGSPFTRSWSTFFRKRTGMTETLFTPSRRWPFTKYEAVRADPVAGSILKQTSSDASALSKLNSWRLPKLIKIKSARSRLYQKRHPQISFHTAIPLGPRDPRNGRPTPLAAPARSAPKE